MSETRLRDLVNAPRKLVALRADTPRWNRIAASLDAIGDTQLAVAAYLEGQVAATTHGALYLAIYGLLQVLFVQQDALRELATALAIDLVLPPDLIAIRELRNASVGHPTDHRERSRNAINRNSMSLHGFELFRYSHRGGLTTEYVNLRSLATKQAAHIETLIEDSIVALESEERQHRQRWRADPLLPKISEGALYAFEKLSEGAQSPDSRHMGDWGLEAIEGRLVTLNSALSERGLLGAHVGIEYVVQEMQYPIAKLRQHLSRQAQAFTEADAAVFVYFLHGKFRELGEMLMEVDEEYNSDVID